LNTNKKIGAEFQKLRNGSLRFSPSLLHEIKIDANLAKILEKIGGSPIPAPHKYLILVFPPFRLAAHTNL
jgi:anti-sigma-K factor RskA